MTNAPDNLTPAPGPAAVEAAFEEEYAAAREQLVISGCENFYNFEMYMLDQERQRGLFNHSLGSLSVRRR